MEFPIEIQRLIHDFARPITRPDWRKGSKLKRIKYCLCCYKCNHTLKNMILRTIKCNSRFHKNVPEEILIPICELNKEYPNYFLATEEEYREWSKEVSTYFLNIF